MVFAQLLDCGPSTKAMRFMSEKPDYYYQAVRADVLHLISPSGKTILDVGCGGGGTGKALKDQGAIEVDGIEYVPEAADYAAGVLDRVHSGDVAMVPLDYPAGHFDVILFLDVLEHLAYPEVALKRLVPLLASDGEIILSLPNVRYIGTLKQLIIDADWPREVSGVFDGTHLRWFTPKSTRRMLAEFDLEIVKVERHASRPFTRITERFPALSRYLSDWFVAQFVYVIRRRNAKANAGSK
jgi:2-polyprenyl-3-methyl-5-hydroxy-6-metoxy-1,4-benzoquinol methylase